MLSELIVLRLLHILGGIYWIGAAVVGVVFYNPAIAESGPAVAGPIFASLQRRRLMDVTAAVAIITLLTGLRLLWIASAGFSASYFRSAGGFTFAASGALALLAFFVALILGRPRAKRGEFGVMKAATAMLVVAAAGMAVARTLY
jgi:hypothetical protein